MTPHVLAATFSTPDNLVLPLLAGIFQGCAYGLLGLGLVLLYKSNRIFNFAQGEFATLAGLVALMFDTGYGVLPKVPYLVALLFGVLAAVIAAVLAERVVIRPMLDRPPVVLVVATVGIALFLIAVEGLMYPHAAFLRAINDALQIKPNIGTIDGIPVSYQDITKLAILAILAVASFAFFKYTRTGTAILAVSQDSTAARVVGIPVSRISLITWAIAGLLGGVAGVLLAPALSVTAGSFTGTVLTASFAAAVLGGMTSLPGAFVGGLLMGIIESFAANDHAFIPGLSSLPTAQGEVAVAFFLILVLLVRPRGLFGQEV